MILPGERLMCKMDETKLSPEVYKRILKFQRDEITGSILYEQVAKVQDDEKNKSVLLNLAEEERNHYDNWRFYTGRDVKPNWKKIGIYKVLCRILGHTFSIKFFEKREEYGIRDMRTMEKEVPQIREIIAQEEEHEDRLLDLLDEERLHYIGSMVLGLNDALVELTGTIAGLTFALANTRLIALSAIITGVSATLSMAASNYLAERAEGNSKALKSSLYTGGAYLITVVLMVLPYLLLPNKLYIAAFAIMLAAVILIIVLFNYYISVAQSLPFFKRFAEMAVISLSVAAISFVIGLLAKFLLGIDV